MSHSGPSPVVDVGIPTYGRPRYLAEAIESVLAQSFDRWRLTVSEDGEGGAAEVVARYRDDPRVTYRRGGRGGAPDAAAANCSVLVSAGSAPYVALLHDDDLWQPDFLERRVAFFERHPECGFVYGPHVDVDAERREIWRAPVAFAEGVYDPDHFVRRFVRDASMRPSPPSVVVKREAYERVGRFDGRILIWESDMWLRIALAFPTGYVTAHDSSYRLHGSQITTRAVWGASWLVWQKHMEELLERELPAAAFTEAERRERRASALLTSALDAVCERRPLDALRALREAIAADRRSLRDPRLALVLAAAPLGSPGSRLVRRIRRTVVQRGVRSRLALPH